MKSHLKFFASILLMLCFSVVCCAQTKIDWKQIKNIPDTLEFKNVLLEHLLFKSAYQPVMESIHQGAIYYDNMLERLRVYENGNWRDLSVSIASDSIGAPLTILGYLQASDIYASQSAYIGKDAIIKGKLNASGPAVLESLKINKTFKVPVTASTTLGVGSMYYDTSTGKLNVLNGSNQWEAVGSDIIIDSAMSSTSTNAVQNKVIKSYVDTNTVSAVAQGSNNGTIAVTKNGTTSDVSVKGLGTAAYTASTDYATANHNHDSSYVSSISEGTVNGAVSVTKNGSTSSVVVHGLGNAAYTNVDSSMSATSVNPVQNKVVKSYVDSHLGEKTTGSIVVPYIDNSHQSSSKTVYYGIYKLNNDIAFLICTPSGNMVTDTTESVKVTQVDFTSEIYSIFSGQSIDVRILQFDQYTTLNSEIYECKLETSMQTVFISKIYSTDTSFPNTNVAYFPGFVAVIATAVH